MIALVKQTRSLDPEEHAEWRGRRAAWVQPASDAQRGVGRQTWRRTMRRLVSLKHTTGELQTGGREGAGGGETAELQLSPDCQPIGRVGGQRQLQAPVEGHDGDRIAHSNLAEHVRTTAVEVEQAHADGGTVWFVIVQLRRSESATGCN